MPEKKSLIQGTGSFVTVAKCKKAAVQASIILCIYTFPKILEVKFDIARNN
jgi:hypothetical protein